VTKRWLFKLIGKKFNNSGVPQSEVKGAENLAGLVVQNAVQVPDEANICNFKLKI